MQAECLAHTKQLYQDFRITGGWLTSQYTYGFWGETVNNKTMRSKPFNWLFIKNFSYK